MFHRQSVGRDWGPRDGGGEKEKRRKRVLFEADNGYGLQQEGEGEEGGMEEGEGNPLEKKQEKPPKGF